MPNTIGEAYVQIKPTTKGIAANLKSEMSSSGEEAAKSFGGKFSGGLASLSGASKAALGVAAVGTAAIGAGAAIYGVANNAAKTCDHIDKMSQKMGMSTTAYQEWDFIMSQSGMSVDSMQAGMKTLTNQLTSAQNGTKGSADAFAQLSISMDDAKNMSREDLFSATVSGLQNVKNETERAALANKLFGRSGSEMAPLLNAGAGSVDAMKQKASQLGLVMDKQSISAGVKLTDSIDQVKRSFSVLGTQLGVAVIPVVQKCLDYIIAHIPQIRSVCVPVFKFIGAAIKVLIGVISALWRGFDTAYNNIRSAITKIKQVANTLAAPFKAAAKLIGNAVSSITGFFDKLKNMFKNPFKLKLSVPTISVSGGKAPWGLGGVGTKPSFSVKWNKLGGIVNNAQLIGAGEAGSEAILPLNPFWNRLDNTLQAMQSGGGGGVLNLVVQLDGTTIGQSTVNYINGQTLQFNASPLMV